MIRCAAVVHIDLNVLLEQAVRCCKCVDRLSNTVQTQSAIGREDLIDGTQVQRRFRIAGFRG